MGNAPVLLPFCMFWIKQAKQLYNGNGNTDDGVPIDVNHYEPDVLVTVQGNYNNLTKSGHIFAGQNTKDDGNGVSYHSDINKIRMENRIQYINRLRINYAIERRSFEDTTEAR